MQIQRVCIYLFFLCVLLQVTAMINIANACTLLIMYVWVLSAIVTSRSKMTICRTHLKY